MSISRSFLEKYKKLYFLSYFYIIREHSVPLQKFLEIVQTGYSLRTQQNFV